MLLALLLIMTFILGMLAGAVTVVIVAFYVGKEKKEDAKKEE